MNLAVITSGFLPVPATKGGAVENLLVNLIEENEEQKNINFNIFSIYDKEAIEQSKKYKYTSFTFVKPNKLVSLLDKITFLIAKNILKKKNSQSYRFIFQRLYFLNKVSKLLKNNEYDNVLLENHPTQYLALKWRKNYIKYDGRYYYHCHNEFPGTYKCYNVIKNTKKFICVSNYVAINLAKYLNLDEKQFTVLRNGIDSERFKGILTTEESEKIKEKYKIKNDETILLYTGRLVPEKGIKELLLSLQQINDKKYKLLIVGTSLNDVNVKTKYEEELFRIIKNNKDRVVFSGFINYSDIWKYYKIADIAILPSICNDSAPLTVIESMISGLPIITTKAGGIPEYANDKCAIIIKRDNKLVENLAEAINKLINNQSLRKEMANESIKYSEKLTKNEFYSNFIKIMNE